MGFENFGIISSTAESRAAKFVDYLEQGKIMATKCQQCGTKYSPPQTECSNCLSGNVEWFEINPSCRLITFTVVRYGPAGFESRAPYTIAVAEFNDGLRMLGHLSNSIQQSDIKVGMKLKITPVKLEGNRLSYEFQKDQ